ncbi:MAG: metalloregulator ArsR/SmtB family transcription factor [bacterium]|nr:metalloregulator ArsR/SmtB family transcription factor [bacterium]
MDHIEQQDHIYQDKKQFEVWASYLRVLAHPTRLAILDALKDGTQCVNDVCELLQRPQPNLSQHLAILRREGIVRYREEGKKRCYYLADPSSIQTLLQTLRDGKIITSF